MEPYEYLRDWVIFFANRHNYSPAERQSLLSFVDEQINSEPAIHIRFTSNTYIFQVPGTFITAVVQHALQSNLWYVKEI